MDKYVTTANGRELTEKALKSIYDALIAPTGLSYDSWKKDRIEKGVIRRIEE